jgi:hypothetical protein
MAPAEPDRVGLGAKAFNARSLRPIAASDGDRFDVGHRLSDRRELRQSRNFGESQTGVLADDRSGASARNHGTSRSSPLRLRALSKVIAPTIHGPNVNRVRLAGDRPFPGLNELMSVASPEIVSLSSKQKDYLTIARRVRSCHSDFPQPQLLVLSVAAREILKQFISARNLDSSDPIANDVPRE